MKKHWGRTFPNVLVLCMLGGVCWVHRAHHSTEPDTWAAQSYTALHILRIAINRAYTETQSLDAPVIRDALATLGEIDTNLGRFSFDPNGEAIHEPVVLAAKGEVYEIFGESNK